METPLPTKEAKYMEGYLELKEASKVITDVSYSIRLINWKLSVVICLISVTNMFAYPEVKDKQETTNKYAEKLR